MHIVSLNIFLFPENRFWHFMQILSYWHNLHEISESYFLEKIRKIIVY